MMKKILLLNLFLLLPSFGQYQRSVSLSAGISTPTDPIVFYDYWKQGPGFSLQWEQRYDNRTGYLVAGEFNSFLFDKSNFVERMGITDRNAAIEGATTMILTAYGAATYSIRTNFGCSLEPFFGFGVMYVRVTGADVRYSFVTSTTDDKNKILLCMPYGIAIKTAITMDIDGILEVKKNTGLLRVKDQNTDFTSLRIGASMQIR